MSYCMSVLQGWAVTFLIAFQYGGQVLMRAFLPYSDKRKQLLKIIFSVNEQNVTVMFIDINAISLYALT